MPAIRSLHQPRISRAFACRMSSIHLTRVSASSHSGALGGRSCRRSTQSWKSGDTSGRRRREPPREEAEHQPGGLAVGRAVDRFESLAPAPPLLGRPEGIEARVRGLGHGRAPAGKVLGGPVAKSSMRVHPGIENGAGEVLIVVLDRLRHGLEELGPGRSAGVPVSVHPQTSQGGPALSAKRLGLGTVLEGAPHHAPAEVLAQEGEDLAGSPLFGHGLGSHWGRSIAREWVSVPPPEGKGASPEGGRRPAAAPPSYQDSGRPRSQQDREPRATGPFPRGWLGARSWEGGSKRLANCRFAAAGRGHGFGGGRPARSAWRTADSPSPAALEFGAGVRHPLSAVGPSQGINSRRHAQCGGFPGSLERDFPCGTTGSSLSAVRARVADTGGAGRWTCLGREPDSVMRRSLVKRWIHLPFGHGRRGSPPKRIGGLR